MKRLYPFNGRNFYGKQIAGDVVPSLVAEVRHGQLKGVACSYVVFSDGDGVKWRISPTMLGRAGLPMGIRATPRAGSIIRGLSAAATPTGVNNLIHYIKQCEGQGQAMRPRSAASSALAQDAAAKPTGLSL